MGATGQERARQQRTEPSLHNKSQFRVGCHLPDFAQTGLSLGENGIEHFLHAHA